MAKTTVTKIIHGVSNSALAIPYTCAQLACGHVGNTRESGYVYACAECKKETTDSGHACACGYFGFHPVRRPKCLTVVGEEFECAECDNYATALARLRALNPGDVQHSRFRPYDSRGGSAGAFYVYKRDPESPSGVWLLLSIDATPEAERVLSALRAAPLSPSEPR